MRNLSEQFSLIFREEQLIIAVDLLSFPSSRLANDICIRLRHENFTVRSLGTPIMVEREKFAAIVRNKTYPNRELSLFFPEMSSSAQTGTFYDKNIFMNRMRMFIQTI